MSIIVLTRASGVVRQGGASFSKLLRGLATFDALFLLIAIISFGFPQLSRWYSRNIFLYIMPIVFGMLHTFRVGSVYVTLAVTFERFHAIICPLKHFAWKKYLLPASVFIAVVYNIPKYFEMEMKVRPLNALKPRIQSLSFLFVLCATGVSCQLVQTEDLFFYGRCPDLVTRTSFMNWFVRRLFQRLRLKLTDTKFQSGLSLTFFPDDKALKKQWASKS